MVLCLLLSYDSGGRFLWGFSTQKLAIEIGGGGKKINRKYSPFLKPAGNNYAENARD